MSFIQQFFTSRDNNANASTFVGQQGRLWWNPDTNQIYSSDGVTPGGIPLAGGGGGNSTPGGINGQVQFNQAGTFGGTANLTINTATGALSAVSFVGNGAPLTSITGANVTGTVADATHAGVADSANSVAGGNVTGIVADAAHAAVADSANSVAGANVTGTVANATTALRAGTVTTNAQPNITSVGTLTSITSSGNISTTGNVIAGNIVGTHVGNLTGTTVSVTGNVTASYFIGNGSALTSITGANVTGNVANATYALSANSASSLVNGASVVLLNSDGTMSFPSNVINSNTNPITLWSTNSSKLLWRDSAGGAPGSPVQTIVTAGNGSATITVATGFLAVQSQKTWTFDTTGNVTFPDATVQTTAYPGTATSLSVSGNITGGNIIGTHVGNITGTTASLSGNVTGGNILTTGIISATGNLTSGNLTTTTANFATFNSSVGGNVIGTLVSTSANAQFINQTNAEGYATVAGYLSVAGNVTGGNILTGGLISATGNATAGNISTGGLITATANITGGNLLTAGIASATGNATFGNISTAGLITATGNITAGNVNTGGRVSATGNILGGNLTVTGNAVITYAPATAIGTGLLISTANSVGGTGYGDVLRFTNASGGATNPNKTFRLNSVGTMEILNSAYANVIFSLTDAGFISIATATGVANGIPSTNGIAMSTNSYIYDDGNYHLTSKAGAIWLNANDGSSVNVNTQMPTGITGGGMTVQGAVQSNAAGAAATSFISGSGARSGIALKLDGGTGNSADMAIRDTSTVASTMYFDVCTGGATNGTFQFRSSNAFSQLLALSNTAVTVNRQMLIGGGSQGAYVTISGTNSYNLNGPYGYLSSGGSGSVGGGGSSGSVGWSLQCLGRIQVNEIDATSDERLKDIQGTIPLDRALQFVRAVDGILYTWKPGFGDEGLKSGFGAQSVHKAGFDHMVAPIPNDRVEESTDADGFTSPDKFQLTLNYLEAIPYHHEVIKHLLDRIEQLEATVAKLTK